MVKLFFQDKYPSRLISISYVFGASLRFVFVAPPNSLLINIEAPSGSDLATKIPLAKKVKVPVSN